MNKFIRRVALIIALAMCLSVLVACAGDGNGNKDDYIPPEADGTRANTPDNLPTSLDYEGAEINVLHRAGEWVQLYECTGSYEENDIVYQAVYERNLRVQNRLNITLNWLPTKSGGLSDAKSEYIQVLSAFVEDYDFFLTTNNTLIVAGMNAYLWDFNTAPYVDFDQPWWWWDCIEELTFDGRTVNFLIGEMRLQNFMKMSAFYFNTRLIEKYLQMKPADFYALVDGGRWTLDEMNRLVAKCYYDSNGNNKRDLGDLYGLGIAGGSGETVNQFIYSCDYEKCVRDNRTGLITLKLGGNNDVLKMIEKLESLYHNNHGSYIIPAIDGGSGYDSFIITYFTQAEYVFLAQRFTAAFQPDMRAMEDDYGILPYPTLYEGDEYVSYIQSSSTSLAVPYVVDETRFRRACAIMEALNADAYRNVTEKFYELALKSKNTRDDDSSRMIDIIYNTKYKCFLDEYGSKASSIMGKIYDSVVNKTSFETSWAGLGGPAQTNINAFIAECRQQYTG